MSELVILSQIAVILLFGIIASAFAKLIRLPDMLLLLLIGVGLGAISYNNQPLFSFPFVFLASVGSLSLAVIVFEGAAQLKIKKFDALSWKVLKLVSAVFILNIFIFSVAVKYSLNISWGLALLLAALMSGTDPSSVIALAVKKVRAIEILEIEALLNTPITVLVPFIILDLMKTVPSITLTTTLLEHLGPFLTKIVAGIGSGILVGIVLFKVLKKAYSTVYSPLAVAVAALITYVLAENLGGNGVLAVTTLGLFFGNVHIREKIELIRFESLFAKSLYILVFVLLGFMLKIPFTAKFLITASLLFIAAMLIRFLAVVLSLRRELNLKEKLFVSLVNSKGIAVAVVAFLLTTANVQGINTVLDVTLLFIFYTTLLSTVAGCFAKYMVH